MISKGSIKLYKFSGAGNTFLICDRKFINNFNKLDIIKFCSIDNFQADGFIFVEIIDKEEIYWEFFNSDGSTAEMCGNATRCVGLYYKQIYNFNMINIHTSVGIVKVVRQLNDQFMTTMPIDHTQIKNMKLKIDSQILNINFINTGVPHAVIKLNSKFELDQFKELNKKIRFHRDFGLAGANVTYLWKIDFENCGAITYERGVENYTQACGTGALAAGILYSLETKHDFIYVEMPGGTLGVKVEKNENHKLIGPVEFIQEYEV